MFRKMPFLLLAEIVLISLLDKFIPLEMKSFLYASSLSIKSVIIFLLPMIIFMLLFKTVSQFTRNATKIILLILAGVIASNFLSTMVSYNIGKAIYHFDLSIALPKDIAGLAPLWSFNMPSLIANSHAMFAGLILGILFSLFKPALSGKISQVFDKIVGFSLRIFIYAIPLFIAGFVIKLNHDKVLESIIKNYALIFAIVAFAQFSYIALIYFLSNKLRLKPFLASIRNMLPASIAGFSSMSSAAAMPFTILGTEKNSANPNFSRLVIPTTVNIHLIGDCFAIPIFAFAVLKNFGMPEPTFFLYLIFAFYFVMAKFSVAAIPGGGIIVMLPVLESYLGFNAEMASLITALYILFDPVITCANVTGNGGFALVLSKVERLFSKKIQATSS